MNELSPELRAVCALADRQHPRVRKILQYALAIMLVDAERAQVIGQRTVNGKEHLHFRTVSGDEFEVVHPQLSPELDKALRDQLWAIYEEGQGQGG